MFTWYWEGSTRQRASNEDMTRHSCWVAWWTNRGAGLSQYEVRKWGTWPRCIGRSVVGRNESSPGNASPLQWNKSRVQDREGRGGERNVWRGRRLREMAAQESGVNRPSMRWGWWWGQGWRRTWDWQLLGDVSFRQKPHWRTVSDWPTIGSRCDQAYEGLSDGCACVHAKLLQSCLSICDLMDVARQAPLSMGFSRQQ